MLNANRPAPKDMTDREILEEQLVLLRAFADTLSAIGNNPFMASFVPAEARMALAAND